MLRGKTKIELIDTRNGHIDTYEDKNMFTNGIQKLVSYNGINDNERFESNLTSTGSQNTNYNGVLSNGTKPTINYFTGGLLLLSDYVTENVNQLQMSKNTNVTGRACLENNESTQNGTRNGSLTNGSFLNGKTYQYIWDFNENQANGNISCVSLTTPIGAVTAPLDTNDSQITYANEYPYTQNYFNCNGDKNGNASNTFIQSKEIESEKYPTKDFVVLVDGTNNCYYCLSSNAWGASMNYTDIFKYWANNRKILLNKYRFPYNSFSIFDNRTIFNGDDELLDSVEIEIPQSITDAMLQKLVYVSGQDMASKISVCNDDEYLYVYISSYSCDIYGNYTNTNFVRDSLLSSYTENSNYAILLKINLSTFVIDDVINLSDMNKNIYSYKGCIVDPYELNIPTSTSKQIAPTYTFYNKVPNSLNWVNDICVYNNRFYFFTKENINENNQTADLVLCSVNLSDLTDIRNVTYNNANIVIKQSNGDSQIHYSYNAPLGIHGTFDGIDFSLSQPFVYMINDKDNLYITFLNNEKTFVVNNNTDSASLLSGNSVNNPFLLNLKYSLQEAIYPNISSAPHWNGSRALDFIYTPNNERLLYIVGGNGSFLKLKNKQQYGIANTTDNIYYYFDNSTISAKYFNQETESQKTVYDEQGCYDIVFAPTMLITINNLETRVEKKNYQKMKVTYTITEVL